MKFSEKKRTNPKNVFAKIESSNKGDDSMMKMNAKRIIGGEVMRKNLKKVVILLLCIMTLLSSSTADVFAATSGGRGTQTMVIQTKSNYWYPGSSSITLKQRKQTLTYQKLWGNKKKTQRGYYGYYNITVSNTSLQLYK